MTRGTPTEALLMGGKPFDRAQARDAGFLRDDVTELFAAGRLRQPVRGVYIDAEVPDDLASRAACLRLRLLRWLPPQVGLGASDALAARGLISREEILVGLEEFSGSRGVARARYLADLIEPKTESFGESCLRLRIVDAGFPRPTAQIEVVDVSGHVVYRLDLGWEDRRVAVEYDGEEFHSTPEQLAHDRRRREALESCYGWRLLAVGRGEIFGPSLALERAVGELLSLATTITRSRW